VDLPLSDDGVLRHLRVFQVIVYKWIEKFRTPPIQGCI
jgi:hypothetical protein